MDEPLDNHECRQHVNIKFSCHKHNTFETHLTTYLSHWGFIVDLVSNVFSDCTQGIFSIPLSVFGGGALLLPWSN